MGPACLPFNLGVANGNVSTAIGFGSTQYAMSAGADKVSWILQKVSLTVDNTLGACNGDSSRLCVKGATTAQGTKDTCQVNLTLFLKLTKINYENL